MPTQADWSRFLDALRLAVLGRDRIGAVETQLFNQLFRRHLSEGWDKVYEYEGIDAWIDYGRVDLKKGPHKLVFTWDNWSEGEISGTAAVVQGIARRHGLTCVRGGRLTP